jgi:type IV pilus assembly protein PilY1
MNRSSTPFPRLLAALSALIGAFAATTALGGVIALTDAPLFLNASAPPLVMLAMSNDEELYHKAYTDFDDVDGDGLIDTNYKDTINYYGYFDSAKCYTYTDPNFVPVGLAANPTSPQTVGHKCSGSSSGRWSGNFLNWVTMTRMDALRKVLFGGYRSTDNAPSGSTPGTTILERAYVPSDNHAWTKFYGDSDLKEYTPYDTSTYPSGITMCNVTPPDPSNDASQNNTITPRLRIASNTNAAATAPPSGSSVKQWANWAAQESKQCLWTSEFTPNASNPGASPSDGVGGDKIAEFTVRVQACVSSALQGNEKCKVYGNNLKPIGLLQDYADADQQKILFGLMTGTYGKRKSGGELRKNIAPFTDEVSSDGTFTGVNGIIQSISVMRIVRYSYSAPGYSGTSSGDTCPSGENSWVNGNCVNWGNPMGEMFLEALRYYVGKSPNSAFTSDDTTYITNLKNPNWVNPYGTAQTTPVAGGGAPRCSKPNILPISTGVSSFDSDEYSKATDVPGLDVNTQTDSVGTLEGIASKKWYVGSISGGSAADVCTSMTVTSLSAVTGICPEAAGLQGSFKVAGLAYYAHQKSTVLQSVSGKAIPNLDTYAVSLAPPTPTLKIPVGSATVTIIPAGYNWRDNNAMQLINFRVITQASDGSSGTFFMNFENAPAGSDYDNDMKGYLSYKVSSGSIQITMWQTGSSSGATQTMGYIIDGVSDSGTYYLLSNSANLSITGSNTQVSGSKFYSFLTSAIDTACTAAGFASTLTGVDHEECHYNVLSTSGGTEDRYMRGIKTHTAGTASTNLLKQPLWYAAKYGGFKDIDGDNAPGSSPEWDTNADGIPDNYFFVTNAGLLETQLAAAFNSILVHSGSASSASVNSGTINTNTRVYVAKFDTAAWSGQFLSYKIATDGTIATVADWESGTLLPTDQTTRVILTTSGGGGTGGGIPFEWSNLSTAQKAFFQPSPSDGRGSDRVSYLRGDRSKELNRTGGVFRNRDSALGDVVDAAPIYVGVPNFRYPDSLESVTYSSFKTATAQTTRTPTVYVGANDGMMHAFNANTGAEEFAFVPSVVLPNMYQLTQTSYSHLYYADGTPAVVDAFYGSAWHTVLVAGLNKGGKEIYALDVTAPGSVTEATASSNVLWEFTSAQDADLGYTFSRPSVVRLHNGKWAAIFGNGYDSGGSGHAILFVVDIQTGAKIAKIDTKVGSTASPNGLATPAVIDLDGDGVADYVYAGDLNGNLWKFDLTSATVSSWAVSYADSSSNPMPLFTAKDSSGNTQPITERPQVGFGPGGAGVVVLFGTGKFLEQSDRTLDTTNPRPQSFYGIFDPMTGDATKDPVSSRSLMQAQTIDFEGPVTINSTTYNLRVESKNAVSSTARGWYIDLVSPADGYENEKQVSDPVLRNGKVIFTTIIPDSDVCNYGGRSWVMTMDSLTGGQLGYSPFDLTADGKFDKNDMATYTSGSTTIRAPASGMETDNGLNGTVSVTTNGSEDFGLVDGTSPDAKCGSSGTCTLGLNPGPGAVGRQSWRQVH